MPLYCYCFEIFSFFFFFLVGGEGVLSNEIFIDEKEISHA